MKASAREHQLTRAQNLLPNLGETTEFDVSFDAFAVDIIAGMSDKIRKSFLEIAPAVTESLNLLLKIYIQLEASDFERYLSKHAEPPLKVGEHISASAKFDHNDPMKNVKKYYINPILRHFHKNMDDFLPRLPR